MWYLVLLLPLGIWHAVSLPSPLYSGDIPYRMPVVLTTVYVTALRGARLCYCALCGEMFLSTFYTPSSHFEMQTGVSETLTVVTLGNCVFWYYGFYLYRESLEGFDGI